MKKILLMIAIVATCIFSLLVLVACEEVETYSYTLNDDGNSYSLTSYNGEEIQVTVPGEYEGKPVTAIGSNVFSGKAISDVILPNSVTTIGNNAFEGCGGLTAISLDGVSVIGNYAFSECSGLKTVNLGSEVKEIKLGAFYKCDGLKEVNLPAGVTSIGEYAFFACTSLETVDLPDTVTSLGAYAFADCKKLSEVSVGNGITEIGNKTFNNCKSLTSVILGNGVCKIDDKVFSGCDKLTAVVLSAGLEEIGEYAFDGCRSLTSITIPDSVADIGSYAFDNCTDLTDVYYTGTASGWATIEGLNNLMSSDRTLYIDNKPLTAVVLEDITEIKPYAFEYCTDLKSITIPDSITRIGDYSFEFCADLTSIYYTGTASGWATIDGLNNLMSSDRSLYIDNKPLTAVVLEDITEIKPYAFEYCADLTSITIPDSVTRIGDMAFAYCYRLLEVYNKSALTIRFGDTDNGYAGYYAKAIYTAPYTSRISTDQDGYMIYAYGDDKTLLGYTGESSELTLPSGITAINQYAFRNCSDLTDVIIPNTVTKVGRGAFDGCDNLRFNSDFGKSETDGAEDSADAHKTGLYLGNPDNPYLVLIKTRSEYVTACEINPDTAVIADFAFYGCSGISSLVIPNDVRHIGDSAFAYCALLSSVTFGNGVQTVGTRLTHKSPMTYRGYENGVYLGNDENPYLVLIKVYSTAAETFKLHDDTEVIAAEAFMNCTNLTTIESLGAVRCISFNAFSDCEKLKEIVLPDTVEFIDGYVFNDCEALNSVIYNGTAEQWAKVKLSDAWNYSDHITQVVCSDDTIALK